MTEEFDRYAGDYDAALDEGLSASGESKDYFAAGRVRWLARCLNELASDSAPRPLRSVLDYGCGTGSTIPLLATLAPQASLVGVDVSQESLRVAERSVGSERVTFSTVSDRPAQPDFDLTYCNGIFHHIPLAERRAAARYVYDSLKPGGLFSFWENNPWNPGTRWVMSRIPFDRDAIPLSALEARRLLREAGFELLRTDFQFIFPRALSPLRFLERSLAALPLGAQYQVLCRRN
jgi:SAM-dependent methyltransferase